MTASHDTGPIDIPLLDETIGDNLERTVAAHGDRDALVVVHQSVRQTYAEFWEAVTRLARALLADGIERGDRVGIWSPNYAEWVHLQYATALVGAILVNVNPAYRTSELEYALAQSGCRLLVSAPEFKTSDYRSMVESVRGDLRELERVVYLWSEEWHELLAAGEQTSLDSLRTRGAMLRPDQPINIQYTSGTTGFPKGATLSHRNILNNGFFTGERCGYTSRDRVCIPVPYYHCFGMVLGNIACTTHGAAMVSPSPIFDAGAVLAAVAAERCTSLYGVPTMFIADLEHPDRPELDLTSLRTGIMAGSPCPVEVMKRVMSDLHMDDVTIAYGMTELSPVVTQTEPSDGIDRRTSSVGRAHPHVELQIVDPETCETVERGAPGEICARGYGVMIGYWRDPERTAETIDAEGWLHTGDLGTMDDDGYVNIVGRLKDMIIRGGENIYPREIEEFLFTHPDVVDVQVVGVPDPAYGEELVAWIKLRPDAVLDDEGIKEYCRGRIARFKIPRYVAFVDDYPMTVTGKIRKVDLRRRAVAALGLEAADGIESA